MIISKHIQRTENTNDNLVFFSKFYIYFTKAMFAFIYLFIFINFFLILGVQEM